MSGSAALLSGQPHLGSCDSGYSLLTKYVTSVVAREWYASILNAFQRSSVKAYLAAALSFSALHFLFLI